MNLLISQHFITSMVLFHLKIINDLYVIKITTTYSLIIDTINYVILQYHQIILYA